jgi:hypothetical protein
MVRTQDLSVAILDWSIALFDTRAVAAAVGGTTPGRWR